MKLRSFLLIFLAAISLAKGASRQSNLPITTTLNGADSSGLPADIQSDGVGAYSDGVAGVTSFLTTNGYNGIVWGDWQFGTLNSTTRLVNISFAKAIPVASGGTATPHPPFTIKNVTAHIEDKCTQLGYTMLLMSVGQTLQCPLIVHFFDSNGDEFRIYMGPNWEPETTFAQVICNANASDGCNDWFVDPIPVTDVNGNLIPGEAIGRLVGPPITGHGKTASDGNQGDYHFRFHFHLTRP
jgi:hypothetical protein